jgi:hypothetical protein
MPSGFVVSTAASLALDVNEGDYNLASLTSAAGGVRITAGTTTVTNVSIANLTNGAVTTGSNALELANADVDLGAGHPATTTTVKSLIAGNATDVLTGATLTITGALTLGTKVVTDTTIDAGGAVTLSSGVAGSAVGSSTITSGGDISIAAVTLGAAGASALSVTCDGGSGGITFSGATSTGAALTATASGSTVAAGSIQTIAGGIATFNGTGVTLTALATNTAGFTVGTATSLDLPALANGTGKVTATAATTFNAPLYTTGETVDLAAAATVSLKALGALANLVDVATVKSLTLAAQDASLDLSTAVLMTTLDYTGKANATPSSEVTDLTYAVFTAASSLTTVDIAGNLNNVILKAPQITTITTNAGSTIRTFTTSGTQITDITLGHQALNGGDVSGISIVDTKIVTLDLSAMKWLGSIVLTGNSSLTTVAMPLATAAADNVQVQAAAANVAVTITGNKISGGWLLGSALTSSSLAVSGTWSTNPGITNAKTWLEALLANNVVANASVTYSIEIDDAEAKMTADAYYQGLGIWSGTDPELINTATELALLPN